jgi:putative acetyltransferase
LIFVFYEPSTFFCPRLLTWHAHSDFKKGGNQFTQSSLLGRELSTFELNLDTMQKQIIRTNDSHQAFRDLVKQLDAYLAIVDGEDHTFYNQFNQIELKHAVIIYIHDMAVCCGAFKPLDTERRIGCVEIKRMFTLPQYRGQKLAQGVLTELEQWAHELGFTYAMLETGHIQADAMRLYERCGYEVIPNYDQYTGVETSVCMGKEIKDKKN